MLSKLSRPCGPRRLDPNHAARVREQTLEVYRKSGRQFADWAADLNYEPQDAAEWDDLLVEWKNESGVTRSHFEATVASLEFFMPRLRGQLAWAHAVKAGWNVGHQAKHAIPMGYRHRESVVAVHHAECGCFRAGS